MIPVLSCIMKLGLSVNVKEREEVFLTLQALLKLDNYVVLLNYIVLFTYILSLTIHRQLEDIKAFIHFRSQVCTVFLPPYT